MDNTKISLSPTTFLFLLLFVGNRKRFHFCNFKYWYAEFAKMFIPLILTIQPHRLPHAEKAVQNWRNFHWRGFLLCGLIDGIFFLKKLCSPTYLQSHALIYFHRGLWKRCKLRLMLFKVYFLYPIIDCVQSRSKDVSLTHVFQFKLIGTKPTHAFQLS
jgi:hypothetical protein